MNGLALNSVPSLEEILAEKRRRGIPPKTLDLETPPAHFHEGQLRAWKSQALEVVICAGAQGGKTEFLIYWLLREIQRCKEWIKEKGEGKFLVVGPTMTLMESQLFQTFRRVFEEDHQLGKLVKGNRPRFTFSEEGLQKIFGFGGVTVTIQFAYASDSNNLESMTALACIWDEAGQKDNKLDSFFACNRRLKVGRSNGMGRRAWGSTPYEWNWFKSKVHDPAFNGERGYELFQFESWMNPVMSREEIEKDRYEMPEWKWEMMYLGLFRKPAGAIFPTFDKARVKRFEIPSTWRRFSGHDFGPIHTAGVFAAQDPKTGVIYVYGTYLPNESRTTEAHIRTMLQKQGLKFPPSAWGGAPSEDNWRKDFTRAGYPIKRPPIADLFEGIYRLDALIARGLLKVFDDLTHLCEEFETYSFELNPEGEPIDRKIADKETYHRIDCCRSLATALYEGLAAVVRSGETVSRFEQEEPLKKSMNLEQRLKEAASA